MDHTAHYALIIVALTLTWGDWRAFAMSATVGASLIAPIPATSALQFYLICLMCEVLIGLLAVRLMTPASHLIYTVSAMLAAFHILGWYLGGYPADSPYRILVKICEYSEIIACSLLSKPIIRLLKNAARFHRTR